MAKTKQEIDVDRELELTINVTKSGAVELLLSSGALETELGPGDKLVLVLRPTTPHEDPSKANGAGPKGDTWNSGKNDGPVDRSGGVHSKKIGGTDKDILGGLRND